MNFIIHMLGFLIIGIGLATAQVRAFSISYWLVMIGVIMVSINA